MHLVRTAGAFKWDKASTSERTVSFAAWSRMSTVGFLHFVFCATDRGVPNSGPLRGNVIGPKFSQLKSWTSLEPARALETLRFDPVNKSSLRVYG